MNKVFHGWRRKAAFAVLYSYLTIALTLGVIEFLGFDTSDSRRDSIDGVDIKVFHPRFVNWTGNGEGIFRDNNLLIGYRIEYRWTERFGRFLKSRHIVEITGFRLDIDGKQYGTVSQGDSVVIDEQSVKVNVLLRVPIPAETLSN